MTSDPPYMSTGAAAKRLGISRRTVLRWAEDGQIRAIRLPSGRYRVSVEDIDKILTPAGSAA